MVIIHVVLTLLVLNKPQIDSNGICSRSYVT